MCLCVSDVIVWECDHVFFVVGASMSMCVFTVFLDTHPEAYEVSS